MGGEDGGAVERAGRQRYGRAGMPVTPRLGDLGGAGWAHRPLIGWG